MFIRIVTGIAGHFDERFPEWIGAAALMLWGANLIMTPVSWTNPDAWALMLSMMSEDNWGLLCVIAGVAWTMALIINGTFQGTLYSTYSPTVRGVCAVISASIWFLVVLSVLTASSSGRGIYPLPLALSAWCVFNSWRDNGRSRAKGHARS